MRTWLLVLLSLVLVIALAGCATKEPTKIQYKNDVITVENYVVNTLSPYAEETVRIEFDVQNNGDQPAYDVKVNFFDIPGFTINKNLDCGIIDTNNEGRSSDNRNCWYNKLDPLDARKIILELKSPEKSQILSPTSYTVSFSISYLYYGVRSATIPIVDGVIKKEPSFKFSQSIPTVGPVVFDIVPMLEREKVVDKKTVKEYWGLSDRIFLTKFVMKHVGKVEGKIKPVNAFVLLGGLTNLEHLGKDWKKVQPCNFGGTSVEFRVLESKLIEISKEFFNTLRGLDAYYISPNSVNETYNTLICNFIPSGTDYEFTAMMKIVYFYNYEFIRSETFVVQPRVGFKQ